MINGKIRVLHDKVLVSNMNFGEAITPGGIVIPGDDGKVEGIHPRWGQVWAVGPEQRDVAVGEWILVEHGRWGRGFKVLDNDQEITVRQIDTEAILVISDKPD